MSRPASRPSVTQGSGIGSQARSTCGIWIRWSISAIPAKPASSAASAIVAQPAGRVLAPREAGQLEDDGQAVRRAAGRGCGAGRSRARARRGGVGSQRRTTRSQPSSASSARHRAEPRVSWAVSTAAGTGRSRSALRARHSAAGVSNDDDDGGQPGGPGRVEPAAPPLGVEAEGVDDGGQPAPQPARRRCRRAARRRRPRRRGRGAPLPTTPRRSSEETISAAGSGPAPTSTSRSRRRRRGRPAPGRAAAPRSCAQSGRADASPSLGLWVIDTHFGEPTCLHRHYSVLLCTGSQ